MREFVLLELPSSHKPLMLFTTQKYDTNRFLYNTILRQNYVSIILPYSTLYRVFTANDYILYLCLKL